MTSTLDQQPLVLVTDVEDTVPVHDSLDVGCDVRRPRTVEAEPLVDVQTLEGSALIQPQFDAAEQDAAVASLAADRVDEASRQTGGWLVWSLVVGVVGLVLVSTLSWVVDLFERYSLLGFPAALAAGALLLGLLGLAVREVRALRRLHDVEHIRTAWAGADGERLQRLILRVGVDLRSVEGARRAADLVDDAGPVAARRKLSQEVMAPLDRRAAGAVATAARQGFIIVTASPSPALDALLLIARAVRLLRQISAIYGYRPGTLALRSLALAAGRDAGAIAIADALAQAAAHSTSQAMAKAGDAAVAAGAAVSLTGFGVVVGVPLAAAGLGLSVVGRTVGATGGAIGGGAAAAWRLYRFGLMVLVASRPVPLDAAELGELKAHMRAEVMGIGRGGKGVETRQNGPS